MGKDSHFHAMMETTLMVMDAVQTVKSKRVLLAMEEVQTVKIVAQNINHKRLNYYKQDKHICMEK